MSKIQIGKLKQLGVRGREKINAKSYSDETSSPTPLTCCYL